MELVLEKVSRSFGDKKAVDSLDLTLVSGSLTVLIGPSGCGKSTTLRLLNRMLDPDGGRVLVDGVDARTLKPVDLRRRMGYVIQQVGLFPHLTVAENIATVPDLLRWPKAKTRRRVEDLLDLLDLPPDLGNRYPSSLSGGQAQRVGVARALAADPPVLLMDEPFGAVDPLTRDKLQKALINLQRRLKKTLVLVTHDLDEAVRLGDRMAIMRDGRLMQCDRVEVVLDEPAGDFVRQFLGRDRHLRKLSRLELGPWLAPNGVVPGISLPPGCMEEDCLGPDDTLRDALSRMMGSGQRQLAVMDREHRFLGVVDLDSIYRALGQDGSP